MSKQKGTKKGESKKPERTWYDATADALTSAGNVGLAYLDVAVTAAVTSVGLYAGYRGAEYLIDKLSSGNSKGSQSSSRLKIAS